MFRKPTSNYENHYYQIDESGQIDSDFTSELANFRQEMSSLNQRYPADGVPMTSVGSSKCDYWSQPNSRKRPFSEKLGYTENHNPKSQYKATKSSWESEVHQTPTYQYNYGDFESSDIETSSENFAQRRNPEQATPAADFSNYGRPTDELWSGYVDFASWQEPESTYDDPWGTDEKIIENCRTEIEKKQQQELLPIPKTAKDDVFSPYYGIEQRNDAKDDLDDETQTLDYKSQYLDRSEPIDDDVNSLMRDAQIIAGIKPDNDDWQVSETTLRKAREIEITVPSELMLPEFCKLCNATFDRKIASSHYGGKKHAQKENQYVKKIYEEKDIDVGRFLNKPRTVARKPPKALISKAVKKFDFACHLCSMRFENRSAVDLHIASVDHRKLVFDRQTEYLSRQILSRSAGPPNSKIPNMTTPIAPSNVGTYYCSVCEKVTNSRQQYENHILSKKHLAKIAENE